MSHQNFITSSQSAWYFAQEKFPRSLRSPARSFSPRLSRPRSLLAALSRKGKDGLRKKRTESPVCATDHCEVTFRRRLALTLAPSDSPIRFTYIRRTGDWARRPPQNVISFKMMDSKKLASRYPRFSAVPRSTLHDYPCVGKKECKIKGVSITVAISWHVMLSYPSFYQRHRSFVIVNHTSKSMFLQKYRI